jgi:Uncharacterized protein family UPF0004
MSETKQKFNIISLGCARNLVDSEVMAGLLHKNNFEMVREPELADIVLVNTCGFIGAAKEESIDTILDVARLKEKNSLSPDASPSAIRTNSPPNYRKSICSSAPAKSRASPKSCASMKRTPPGANLSAFRVTFTITPRLVYDRRLPTPHF